MGCDRSRNPAGIPGPVREPVPVEPEVVGIDYERQLPANKSIYVGESARFLLVFDPVEFICNENDFSTSDDDVTVTMEEGGDNVVRISVAETVGVGSVVEVRFRDQLIMYVTAASGKRIGNMSIAQGKDFSNDVMPTGFELPSISTNTTAVLKLRGGDYDVNLDFVNPEEGANFLICTSGDLPQSLGNVVLYFKANRGAYLESTGRADVTYTFDFVSITDAGVTIYP